MGRETHRGDFLRDFKDDIMTMRDFINRYATGATTGLFLVSGVSGLALFFHLMPQLFKEMHEWLSLVLFVPVGLHLYRNWPAFLGYVRRRTLFLPLALSLGLAAIFAVPALSSGTAPSGIARIMTGLEQSTLADMSILLATSPEALVAHLAQAGYSVSGPADTLAGIAEKSGRPAREIIMAATAAPAP